MGAHRQAVPLRAGAPSALAALALTLWGCGGGRPVYPLADGGQGALTGAVIKGPVGYATVTAYRLDNSFNRGAVLASTQADGQGQFSLSLPPYSGHLLFVASTGVYTEEAVGGSVKLDGNELRAVVHDYRPGVATGPVLITPISHWAMVLASFWTANQQEPLPQAVDEAYQHLNAHFGNLDWRAVTPTDFNSVDGGVGQGDADRAGLILAALSQKALAMANRAAVTPGVGVTSLDLVNALADDLAADGFFDGVGTKGPLHLPASQPVLPANAPASATLLDGQTVRGALAASMSAYLQNPLDASGLTFRDVQGLLNELSTDSDSRIFRTGGTGYDTTPPLILFSPTPPLYVPDASYTLRVLAADPGSGVADVYAQTGANPALSGVVAVADAGVLSDGGCIFGATSLLPDAGCVAASLYQFQLTFPTPAHYPYTVYAVDRAGNSTQTNGTSLSFTMTFDNAAPQIELENSTLVYWDERGMTLQSDAGVPIVPPAYVVTTSKSTIFAGSHDIYKAGTRLSWGALDGGPTADQLNNQDPGFLNVPFAPYDIPYDPQVDSPIVSVTYSASCSGAACGTFTASATGSLIPDTTTTASARFLMPLTSDTLPALAQISGPATIEISVTATDGAGNSTTKTADTVTFHVIGPPLAVTEDPGYASAGDAHSTYPHLIANNTYAVAFDAGSPQFTPDALVRLVRYVVYNPSPEPVGLYAPVSGNWSASEEWDDDVQAMSQFDNISSTADHLWCGLFSFGWQIQFDLSGGRCQNGDPAWPCPGEAGVQRVTHANGYSGCVVCDTTAAPIAHANPSQTNAFAAVQMSYYANPRPGGGETTPESRLQTNANYVIVPPASGASPGEIALYVNRPVGATRSIPLQWQNIYPNGGQVTHYQNYVQDFWDSPTSTTCQDPQGGTDPETDEHGSRDLQNLNSAQSVVSGSFNPSTYAIVPGSSATGYGESQTFTGPNFSRSISQ